MMGGMKRFIVLMAAALLAASSALANAPAQFLAGIKAATYDSTMLGVRLVLDSECPFAERDAHRVIRDVFEVAGIREAEVSSVKDGPYTAFRDRSVFLQVKLGCIRDGFFYTYHADVRMAQRVDGVRNLLDWQYGSYGHGHSREDLLDELDRAVGEAVIDFVGANDPDVSLHGMRAYGLATVARTNRELEG